MSREIRRIRDEVTKLQKLSSAELVLLERAYSAKAESVRLILQSRREDERNSSLDTTTYLSNKEIADADNTHTPSCQ